MNPFIFVLILSLGFWLIINLPFILFFTFNSFMAIFSFDEEPDERDLLGFILPTDLQALFLPTMIIGGLFGWLIILIRISFKYILGILALYFGWQLIQQMILLGNLWKWDGWSWTGFVFAIMFVIGAFTGDKPSTKQQKIENVEGNKDKVFKAFK